MIGAALVAVMLGFAIAACERAVDKPAVEKPPEPVPGTELALNDAIRLTDENQVKTDIPVEVVAYSEAFEDDHTLAALEPPEAPFAITWTVSGNLEANTVDVYLVTVHQAGRLTAQTTGAGPDTYGYIKDSEGATLAEDDDGGGGANFSVTAQISAGDYQIWVKGYDPSVSGSYVIRVDFTAGGRSTPPSGDDHGNTRSTATSVAVPSSSSGTLTAGDVDYFTVTVSQPGTLTVNTSGSTDTYGTLEDASGGTLATNDDGGSGANFRLSSAVSAGTYYVRVAGYDSATTGSYTLTLAIRAEPITSEFDIDIWTRTDRDIPVLLRSAIFYAVRFWESAISGDLQPIRISSAYGDCPSPSLVGETIDDLAILVRVQQIDGPSGTLAQAGPCLVRISGNLPVVGKMVFDVDDISGRSQQALNVIAVHEMAHVLGVGTLWGRFNLLRLPSIVDNRPVPGRDTHFTGRRSIAAFDRLGGRSYLGNKVPVENDTTIFGLGALDSHWRESVFGNENMTPSIGRSAPVSILTIESLADLGYQVNTSAAELYRLPRAASSSESELIILENDILEGPVSVIDREGNVVEVIGSPSTASTGAGSSPSVEYVRVKER